MGCPCILLENNILFTESDYTAIFFNYTTLRIIQKLSKRNLFLRQLIRITFYLIHFRQIKATQIY